MTTPHATEVADHFMAVVQEMIALNGSFKKHVDFAKAAFGNEVANYNGKWNRLRSQKNHLTLADIVSISAALNTDPSILLTIAYFNMRKSKRMDE